MGSNPITATNFNKGENMKFSIKKNENKNFYIYVDFETNYDPTSKDIDDITIYQKLCYNNNIGVNFINKFNGFSENDTIVFKNKKDAEIALEWVHSLMIINKLHMGI